MRKTLITLVLLSLGAIGCGGASGAAARQTACDVYATTHRVSCELCERTEGPCPFANSVTESE